MEAETREEQPRNKSVAVGQGPGSASRDAHENIFEAFTEPKGLPGGSDGKESACNAGDMGLIPESGRFPGEGNGNPLQYSCLENPMEKEPGGPQPMGLKRTGHNSATKQL